MSFAGVPKSELALYSLGEQFAEKFHAYTRLRENPSRVKDLLEMTLMLESLEGLPAPEDLRPVLKEIFDRDDIHAFPTRESISFPPPECEQLFRT